MSVEVESAEWGGEHTGTLSPFGTDRVVTYHACRIFLLRAKPQFAD